MREERKQLYSPSPLSLKKVFAPRLCERLILFYFFDLALYNGYYNKAMKNYTSFALGLAILPALVAPASASDRLYAINQAFLAYLDTYSDFFTVISAVKEGHASPSQGAVEIEKLAVQLRRQDNIIESNVARLTASERDRMSTTRESKQYYDLCDKIDGTLDALERDFNKKNFYGSAAFRKAFNNFRNSIVRG